MKKLIIPALFAAFLPISAGAAYQYVNTSGQLVTVSSMDGVSDQAPNSGYVFLPDTQVATTTESAPVQTSITGLEDIDLTSYSLSELKSLRSRINGEIDSRSDSVTTSSVGGASAPEQVDSPAPVVHRASWDDTKDPYYQDGVVYVETTMDVDTQNVWINQGHTRITVSRTSKTPENNGNYLYSFTPDQTLSSGSYGLAMLQAGHTPEYNDDGGLVANYVIRLVVQ